ncbi:MAG TPA: DegT/DnrJ/EryC1/StrS aminotransferase family protein [Candidatus Eremiobacteraceae bacterium]|nr:DegT/DnrJ/EryC1/StrS aminotransferase family protein [Candidatus Eremiobacteraceae bacterium]
MRSEFLPYCRPYIEEDDIAAVTDTLSRGWLTTGPKVREFEQLFGAAAGVKHAVALNSCTAAIHLGFLALGAGEGDEIVMPSLSFVAGANCAVQIGAKPVFCDVDPETLCLSVETIERVVTPRTKIIMTMHYAGRPANAAPIVAWAKPRGIKVFEDAALAIGMLDDGQWSGTRADAAAYSFYATKNVTSAEGGMFLTNDDALMERVRILALHGMDRDAWKRYTSAGSWRYDIMEHGYKDNMPDLAAALGISQLKKLDTMQRRRDEIAQRFIAGVEQIPGVSVGGLGKLGSKDRHSWCMFPIVVDEREAGVGRDQLIEDLKAKNIGTSVHYIPSHHFTAHKDLTADVPVTEEIWQRLISLPLFPSMSDADVTDVLEALRTSVPGKVSQAV